MQPQEAIILPAPVLRSAQKLNIYIAYDLIQNLENSLSFHQITWRYQYDLSNYCTQLEPLETTVNQGIRSL